MSLITVGTFVAYLALMLYIGFFFSKRAGSLSDFYLGGRKMNKWAVALSAQASDMSGWLLMGVPGACYVSGISDSWICIGLGIGTYLNWKIVAERLRVYSHACNDSITLPDFFANRFRDRSGLLRSVAAIIILLFFIFYTAAAFVSCAKLFQVTFSIPETVNAGSVAITGYSLALLIGAVVVVSYTLLGGFMAVCWTDVIQGLLMFLAVVAIPAIVISGFGGFEGTVNAINENNMASLNIFTKASSGKAVEFNSLVSNLAWGLGYFGMPHILVRFMSIKRSREIADSRMIAMTWVVISLAAAVVIGLLGPVYAKSHGLSVDDPERILMLMINAIFNPHGFIGHIAIGILMSAILAAIMSTADSQLLVAASAFTNDFYKTVIRKKASNRELITVSRLAVGMVAVIGALMALNRDSDFVKAVMNLVSFAWGGFGSAFGPVILLSLFWKRINLAGAVAGMVTGTLVSVLWKFVLQPAFPGIGIFSLYELAPGFVFSLVAAVIASLLTKAPSGEIAEEFSRVSGQMITDRRD